MRHSSLLRRKLQVTQVGSLDRYARQLLTLVEITTLREGMWDAVSSRKHTLDKVFPFGSGSDQVMLNGTVALELKNGASAEIEWAGKMELEKGTDGKYRLKFYQVYLVSLTSFLEEKMLIFIGYRCCSGL
jgi:hypothetical protein